MSGSRHSNELVDQLAEDGTVLGSTTRRTMRRANLLHGAVFIVVVNSKGELGVHRRAAWKDVWPRYWDLAFGGVVGAGEEWDVAAARELAEEAGSEASLRYLGEASYADDRVRHIARVYLARDDGPFPFPDGEVDDFAWVPLSGIGAWLVDRQVCPDSLAIIPPLLASLDLG
jgi:8-oxo-dGTP pyrophosphatase MutT (NUDIX family)